MTSRLIRESFHAPLLTALLIAAGTTIGAFWMQDLRRDVFPDLSAPVFNVITQNAAMGAEETRIDASFCAAISIAKQQKSVSLEKRAEGTYAEYRRQKASTPGRRGFRLPLW